jgi:hypothetical protein
VNIRDVHLNCGKSDTSQCVSDSIRIRSKGTGIDDYAVGLVSGRVDYVDDLAFDIRLECLQVGSMSLARTTSLSLMAFSVMVP